MASPSAIGIEMVKKLLVPFFSSSFSFPVIRRDTRVTTYKVRTGNHVRVSLYDQIGGPKVVANRENKVFSLRSGCPCSRGLTVFL